MILKSLSVFAVCAAFTASAAGPVAAQRQNSTSSKSQGQPSSQSRGSAQAQQPSNRPKPWWLDDKSKKELGLTAAQVKAIDEIYTSSKDELASYRENMDRERTELDQMIFESKVEQWVVLRKIDRMEMHRSSYNKTFWMMLYRMNRALTAEQRVKLQEMERKARDNRGGRGGDKSDPQARR
jgi:Spy/CpxP family protein refolding chaperone